MNETKFNAPKQPRPEEINDGRSEDREIKNSR
jgi:hypothetical protein